MAPITNHNTNNMCLYPKIIKNRKYTKTKKNGGVIPPLTDSRVKYIAAGCGKCLECKKQKAREWSIRLQEELKTSTNAKFITLTFSNESIEKINATGTKIAYRDHEEKYCETPIYELKGYEKDNAIATWAVRHFLERWRKEYKTSLRHWLVTELGHKGTENIHLHGIIWLKEGQTILDIERIWQYGWIWKGKLIHGKLQNYVSAKTVNYIVKYVNKADTTHRYYNSIILTSAGIGKQYLQTTTASKHNYNDKETDDTYKLPTGHKTALPKYYKKKKYTEEELEQMWIHKLDKEERYVLGEKISIKQGEEEYYKALKYAQQINRQMGYNDATIDWTRKQYELERREMMYEKRLKAKQYAASE